MHSCTINLVEDLAHLLKPSETKTSSPNFENVKKIVYIRYKRVGATALWRTRDMSCGELVLRGLLVFVEGGSVSLVFFVIMCTAQEYQWLKLICAGFIPQITIWRSMAMTSDMIKISSCNVNGLSSDVKRRMVLNYLKQRGSDVVMLQETPSWKSLI